MSVSLTYFVHSITTDNQRGIATGWRPGVLSDVGIERAARLGKQLAGRHFDAIFCSDLQRAIDSARLFFGKDQPLIQDDRLRECDYGSLTNQPAAQFKTRMKDFVDTPFPEGESYMDVQKRIASFLQLLSQNYPGKHVAVVGHQATQLALEVLLRGRTWQQAIDEDWRATQAWQPGWQYSVP